MKIYVNVNAGHDGNGTEQMPFRHINDAAKIAQPGDEVWVAPGVYREYVDPVHAGREDARITYRSVEPLGAVITGAERIQSWVPYKENVWAVSYTHLAWCCLEVHCIRYVQWYYHCFQRTYGRALQKLEKEIQHHWKRELVSCIYDHPYFYPCKYQLVF